MAIQQRLSDHDQEEVRIHQTQIDPGDIKVSKHASIKGFRKKLISSTFNCQEFSLLKSGHFPPLMIISWKPLSSIHLTKGHYVPFLDHDHDHDLQISHRSKLSSRYESEETIWLAIASMGTFAGHIIPGSSLALLGLWHTINTIKAYHLKGSSLFRSSYWYPFQFHLIPSLKYLELLFVLTFSILAITMQILDFPFLHFTFKLNNFEHATMFLHLAIFSGFTLFSDLCSCSDDLTGVSGILATSVFSQELFLLHYHSADHVGLEGHYHWLLQIIVLVSVVACLVTVLSPGSFPAALVLAVTVVFQGCWFVNMGFMLWDPRFVPEGCVMMKMSSSNVGSSSSSSSMYNGAVVCEVEEADFRARGLANLQFSWILGGILIVVGFFTCLKFARKNLFRQSSSSSHYQQLRCRVATSAAAGDGSVSMTNLKPTFPIACC